MVITRRKLFGMFLGALVAPKLVQAVSVEAATEIRIDDLTQDVARLYGLPVYVLEDPYLQEDATAVSFSRYQVEVRAKKKNVDLKRLFEKIGPEKIRGILCRLDGAASDGGYFIVNESNPLASRNYKAEELRQMFRDLNRGYRRSVPFPQWLRTGFTGE